MKKILIIDDSILVCKMLEEIFKDDDEFEVISALNASDGIENAMSLSPSIILLDVTMPQMNGFEVFDVLKKIDVCKNIPILFITSSTEDQIIEKCFTYGAKDYVKKPFNKVELKSRVLMHIENNRINQQFKQAMSKLEKMANTDPLTNLYNRRYFIENAYKMNESGSRNQAIVLCDVDNFKIINDKYGHDNGDYVLKELSRIFKEHQTEDSIIARWGGEEFIMYFHDKTKKEVYYFCECVRQDLEKFEFKYSDGIFKVTASFGMMYFDAETPIEQAITNADRALYTSKANGKNTITVI